MILLKLKRCPWCGEKCIELADMLPNNYIDKKHLNVCSSCNKEIVSSNTKRSALYLISAFSISVILFCVGMFSGKIIFKIIAVILLFIYGSVLRSKIDYDFDTCSRRLPAEEGWDIQKINAPFSAESDRKISLLRENIYLIKFSDIPLEKLVTHHDLVSDYRRGIPVYIEKRKGEDFYRFGFLKPELLHLERITPGVKFDLIDDDVIATGSVK